MDAFYLLAGLISFVVFLHFYFSRYHQHWQNNNVPCAKNIWPIIGHAPPINFIRNFNNIITKIYKDHPNDSMVGFYNYRIPCLLLRDPELVKTVMITNFASFSDNDLVLKEDEEPLLAKNPFFTNGIAWKTGRSRLTTSLTGNKLKGHTLIINGTMKKLSDYVEENIAKSENKVYEVEGKGLFSKVTAECGANVGFGIEGNCFDDSKLKESFVACGKMFFDTDLTAKIKILAIQFPWLMNFLNMPFVPERFEKFFRELQ